MLDVIAAFISVIGVITLVFFFILFAVLVIICAVVSIYIMGGIAVGIVIVANLFLAIPRKVKSIFTAIRRKIEPVRK